MQYIFVHFYKCCFNHILLFLINLINILYYLAMKQSFVNIIKYL